MWVQPSQSILVLSTVWMSRLMLKSFNRSIHHWVSLCCRTSSNQAQTTQMNEHSNDLWLFNYPCITPHSTLQPSHILKSCRVVKSLMVLNSVTAVFRCPALQFLTVPTLRHEEFLSRVKTPFTLNTGDRRELHNEILLGVLHLQYSVQVFLLFAQKSERKGSKEVPSYY